jgi:hypothetical protein
MKVIIDESLILFIANVDIKKAFSKREGFLIIERLILISLSRLLHTSHGKT